MAEQQQQAHGPLLGETLFSPNGNVVPQPFMAALIDQLLDNDGRRTLFAANSAARNMVLQAANMVTLKVTMDKKRTGSDTADPVPATELTSRLQAARDVLHLRGQLPVTLWLSHQQAHLPMQESISLVAAQLSTTLVKHVRLSAPSATSSELQCLLLPWPALTHLTLDSNLNSVNLPVVLEHGPQLKHVSVADISLPDNFQCHKQCHWDQLTITQPGAQQPHQQYLPQPAELRWENLARVPVTNGHRVKVKLPDDNPALLFSSWPGTGVNPDLVERLWTHFTFDNLATVDMWSNAAQTPAAGLAITLERIAPLRTDDRTLQLRGWNPTFAWPAIAPTLWSKVRFVSLAHAGWWDALTHIAVHLREVELDSALSDQWVSALAEHAPGLHRLAAAGVDMRHPVLEAAAWQVGSLKIAFRQQQEHHGFLPVALLYQLGLMPAPGGGQGTVELTEGSATTLFDIVESPEGLYATCATAAQRWTLVGSLHTVALHTGHGLVADDQPAGLAAALVQLQPQRAWIKHLQLKGRSWVLTPQLGLVLQSVHMRFPMLETVELQWDGVDRQPTRVLALGVAHGAETLPFLLRTYPSITCLKNAQHVKCTLRKALPTGVDTPTMEVQGMTVSSTVVNVWVAAARHAGQRLLFRNCTVEFGPMDVPPQAPAAPCRAVVATEGNFNLVLPPAQPGAELNALDTLRRVSAVQHWMPEGLRVRVVDRALVFDLNTVAEVAEFQATPMEDLFVFESIYGVLRPHTAANDADHDTLFQLNARALSLPGVVAAVREVRLGGWKFNPAMMTHLPRGPTRLLFDKTLQWPQKPSLWKQIMLVGNPPLPTIPAWRFANGTDPDCMVMLCSLALRYLPGGTRGLCRVQLDSNKTKQLVDVSGRLKVEPGSRLHKAGMVVEFTAQAPPLHELVVLLHPAE